MNSAGDFNQSGFDAIADKMKELYPDQKGIYYGTIIPGFLGGNEPLDGVEVWKSEEVIPHWHYVTYGFTELFEKESEILDESGFGFELTFRLKREEEEPPTWPVSLLQNIARYVFSSGNVFRDGHHINCNGPIALDTDTKLTALAFRKDPQMGEMDTPNGKMTFLQAVAVTNDEMEALMCWKVEKFLNAMEKEIPLCITDLSRSSCMDIPSFYSLWKEGTEKDGSSTGFLYIDKFSLEEKDGKVTFHLGAGHIKTLINMIMARLGKERNLYLQGNEARVNLTFGEKGIFYDNDLLTLSLPKDTVEELCRILKPHKGTYTLTSFPLTVELSPTNITDENGNIIKTIE